MMETQPYEVTRITPEDGFLVIHFLNPPGETTVDPSSKEIAKWRKRGKLLRTQREPGEEVLKVGEPAPVSIRPEESEPAPRDLDDIEM